MSSARSRIEFGYGLAHADAGDLRHDVVQAFDVLDVERRVDVDALAQAAPRHRDSAWGGGCPRALVWASSSTSAKSGRRAMSGVEIHLLERVILVVDGAARDDLEAVEQRLGLFAAVRLDHADDHVGAVFGSGAGLLQHLVGLADARSGTEEDLQAPGTAFFLLATSSRASGDGRWSDSRR